MSIDSDNQTYREVLRWASSFLEQTGKEQAAAEWLLRERFGMTKGDLLTRYSRRMPEDEKKQYAKDVQQFVKGIPAQHIIGHEWFYGRPFKVSPDVLIPRPETEELMEWFLGETSSDPKKVLDIGTGSGILAVTAKLERPQYTVTAVDISKEAMRMAEQNAKRLKAEVRFIEGDLTEPVSSERFDIVLSNPPYISKEEIEVMDESVRLHEPKVALFAEENGLAVYRKLAAQLPSMMNPEGAVYLEIGYQQGKTVQSIFQKAFPEASVQLRKDMGGRDRMIRVDLKKTEGKR